MSLTNRHQRLCVQCEKPMLDSESGVLHERCGDAFGKDWDREMEALEEALERQAAADNAIIDELRKTLEKAPLQTLELTLATFNYRELVYVTRDQVTGRKISVEEFFGEKAGLGFLYEDVDTCTMSDSRVGQVWLPIFNDRFLLLTVWE